MNCEQIKPMLMPFQDGELSAADQAAVERELDGCASCQEELAELKQVSAFASEAFTASIATAQQVDLSGLYDGVMAQIAAEDAVEVATEATASAIEGVRAQRQVVEDEPGLLDRITTWFGELFRLERPMALAMVAAAAVAAIIGVSMSGGGVGVEPQAPQIASPDSIGSPIEKTTRRGPEMEAVAANRNSAFAAENEVAKGELTIIEFNEEDEQPLVLWHTVNGEGVPAPSRGL
jgi:anti-sigma factor RsiW